MAYTFQIYKDKAGEFRFRFKASNGETIPAISDESQPADQAQRVRLGMAQRVVVVAVRRVVA